MKELDNFCKVWKDWNAWKKLNSSLARDLVLNLLSVLFLKEQPEGSWAGVEALLKKEKSFAICDAFIALKIEWRNH